MLRVVHVLASAAAANGGSSTVPLLLASHLRRMGVDARLVTTTSVSMDTGGTHNPSGPDGVPLAWARSVGPKKYALAPGLAMTLRSEFAHGVDILHIHSVFRFPGWLASFMALTNRTPYIVTLHGSLHPQTVGHASLAKALTMPLWHKLLLNCANTIHCTTEAEAEHCRRFTRSPIIVIPPPAPEYRPEQRLPRHPEHLLFLGRVVRHKRLELIIDGLAASGESANLPLLVAGPIDAEYQGELTARANGVGVRVTFLGYADEAMKALLFAGAEALVVASFSESFSMAAVESIQRDCPVIVTSNLDIAPQLARLHAAIVAEPTPVGLANAIRRTLAGGGEELGEGMERFRHIMGWEAVTTQYIELYERICAGPLGPRR